MTDKPRKWLYRMEADGDVKGLWYNAYGEYVFNIGDLEDCPSQELDMSYDERYKQDGHNWFSACTNVEDLHHWFSIENAKELLNNGFVFTQYLAVDYVEYENETVFRKDTALVRREVTLADVYGGIV